MILHTQDECCEHVRKCIYALPARLRRVWKPIWSHLYG